MQRLLLWCAVAVQTAQGLSAGYGGLAGVSVAPLGGGPPVDLKARLDGTKALVVLGTYAADFNAIEYCQRVAHYAPKLRERGVSSISVVLNAEPASIAKLRELLDLGDGVELLSDPSGAAGRAFGVSRGWLPDDDELRVGSVAVPLNAYAKLFGMLFGLGAWATLPAVIGGYIGNPFRGQPWIADALAQGQSQNRWPVVVDLDANGAVKRNPFDELPVVGAWPRRPLELATLRLQTMLGVSLAHWDALKPEDLRTLTQLGGCVVSDGAGGVLYEHRDPGICAVANFEEILDALDAKATAPPASS